VRFQSNMVNCEGLLCFTLFESYLLIWKRIYLIAQKNEILQKNIFLHCIQDPQNGYSCQAEAYRATLCI
jgi:hypothetical protein